MSTTRRSPTSWRRAFTLRAASSRSRTYICKTPGTATCAGARTARCANSMRCIRASEWKSRAPAPTSTIAASVEQLDLATVIKVSQALSGEIVLEKLIEMLMRTALEQAGAERGLLILSSGAEQRIDAEATTNGNLVTVHLRDKDLAATVLPESVLHYVHAHPGKRYSRRCVISQSIFCRSLHRSASRAFHSLSTVDQPGKATSAFSTSKTI